MTLTKSGDRTATKVCALDQNQTWRLFGQCANALTTEKACQSLTFYTYDPIDSFSLISCFTLLHFVAHSSLNPNPTASDLGVTLGYCRQKSLWKHTFFSCTGLQATWIFLNYLYTDPSDFSLNTFSSALHLSELSHSLICPKSPSLLSRSQWILLSEHLLLVYCVERKKGVKDSW
uniref:Uncharacterized protein n=1 Tax=Molossus molossus TaxID=27622 RepID=A0A7J8HGZ5_MOLMO|nr:hypothetical protein HJG59_010993 [Molossus molossus]